MKGLIPKLGRRLQNLIYWGCNYYIYFLKKCKKMWEILVIWDVMVDKYSFWEVKRLNPEWPNPLLNIEKEEERLGWSANVAANIASLNKTCDLVWLVWNDKNKDILEKLCKKYNIKFYGIELQNYHTILKHRFVETTYNQQLLRVDYEKKVDLQDNSITNILDIVKNWNYKIIIISDYNKWIINKNLIEKLKKITKEQNILVLVDSKPKNYELFNDFNLIKPNFKEFCEMIWEQIENNDKQIEKYWIKFVKQTNTNIVITRWPKGASLITKDWKYSHLETESQKVFDVSWAWDTFIATIAYALNEWYELVDAVKLANKASGIVVGKVGTAVVGKKELFSKKC